MFSTRVRLASIFTLIIAAVVFSAVKFGRVSEANSSQAPAAMAVNVTSAEVVTDVAGTVDGNADPGDTLEYTVTVTNSGTTDATGLQLDSTIDTTTSTLVAGSTNIGPVATNDSFSDIGNVNLVVPAAGGVLANDVNPDGAAPTLTGFGNTLGAANANAPGATITSTNGGSLTVNADGSFNYDPPRGGTTGETFFYTISDGSLTNTGTATIAMSGRIWFINNAAGACPVAPCDGRLSHPYISTGAFQTDNTGVGSNPAAGDYVFIYTGTSTYNGSIVALNNQKFIGQGASATILSITGFTTPSGTSQLPGTGAAPTLGTTAAGNAITLAAAANATLRGFAIGSTVGFKIASGANFGTLTVSEVGLLGTGGDLSLSTGALAATFTSIVSTGSAATQGIVLTSVTGTMTVTGGTTITNPTTQGILVTGSTASIDFGNTSITGGTNQISLQNNSAGTRTFGTLSLTNGTGAGNPAFLHSNGGGTTTAGATTISNPAGTGIDIQSSTTLITFGVTSVSKAAAGVGVNLGGTGTGNLGGVTFNSLAITTASGAGLVGRENAGTITVTNGSGNISATGGPAIDITKPSTTTPLNMAFANVSSATSPTQGINLLRVSGSLTAAGGSLATATLGTLKIDTSTANFTYPGTITQATASQRVVDIQNCTAGTVALSGAVTSSGGTGTGINLVSNTGATVNFTGGINLVTNTNPAFTATGGGTVSATQNNTTILNTLTATTASALNVANTTIGVAGLTFRSITSNGSGTSNGIIIDNAGSGGLTVTGNAGTCTSAATCTGGTISNKTGGDGTGNGIGIYVNNSSNISLTRMKFNDFTNYAVRGTTVTGFTMNNCFIDGANGDSAGADEGTIIFDGLFGTASFSTDTIKGGIEDNFRVANVNGTLSVTIDSCTIRDTSTTASGNDNVNFRTNVTANVTAHVTNNTFAATNADHIQTIASDASSLTIVATGNTLSGGGGGSALGQGITISGGNATPSDSTETVRFNISSNNMTGTIQGGAINVNEGSGNGNWQGQINGNVIGNVGSACSGASQSSGIRLENHSKGTLTGKVTNNQVHQTCGAGGGISLTAGDTTASGLGNGPLNATVTGNTIDTPGGSADHGVVLVGGAGVTNNSNLICLDLLNNSSTGSPVVGSSGFAYRIRQRFGQTVSLPGYAGANNNNAAVQTYFQGRPNTAIAGDGGTYSITNTVGVVAPNGPGFGFVNTPGGAPCSQPIVPTRAPPADDSAFNVNGQWNSDIGLWIASFQAPLAGRRSDALTAGQIDQMLEASLSAEIGEQRSTATYFAPAIAFAGSAFDLAGEVASKIGESISPTVEAQGRDGVRSTKSKIAPEAGGQVTSAPTFTLPAGGTVKVTYRVTVNNGPYASGINTIPNVSTISGSNFATVTSLPNPTTIALDVAPDLSVTATDSLGTAQPGVTVTYSINYANATGASSQDAAGATLTATLPANTTLNGAGSPGWSCVGSNCSKTIAGTIAAGSNASVPFAVDVAAALPQSALTIATTATIAENPLNLNGTDSNLLNNTSTDTDTMVGVWLGGTSTDWAVNTNWSNNLQPATPQNISVPSGAGNSPAVTSADVTVNGLVLNGKDLAIGAGRRALANTSVVLGSNLVTGLGLLELGTGAPITRTTGQVESSMKKNFAAPGPLFVFPVGTTGGRYSPLDVTVTAGTGDLTVKANTGVATVAPVPLNPATTLHRYWTLSGSGITSNITFHYLSTAPTDVFGNEAVYQVIRVTGGTTAIRYPNSASIFVTPASDTFTVMGLSVYSDWTAGEPLAPTAANVNLSGRVVNRDGRGVGGARVEMFDPETQTTIYAMTNPIGYYHFMSVQAGRDVVIGVTDKRYTFEARVISVNDQASNVDFVAMPPVPRPEEK